MQGLTVSKQITLFHSVISPDKMRRKKKQKQNLSFWASSLSFSTEDLKKKQKEKKHNPNIKQVNTSLK